MELFSNFWGIVGCVAIGCGMLFIIYHSVIAFKAATKLDKQNQEENKKLAEEAKELERTSRD